MQLSKLLELQPHSVFPLGHPGHVTFIVLVTSWLLQHHTLCPLARQEGTGGGAVPNQERLNILTNSRQTSICILRAIIMSHVHFGLQRRLEN